MHTEDGNNKYGFEFVNCQMFWNSKVHHRFLSDDPRMYLSMLTFLTAEVYIMLSLLEHFSL